METNTPPGIDATVSGIDLEALRRKLSEEKGWDDGILAELERQYRMFLSLKVRHPDQPLVPTQFIDEMWHAHILDTMAYAEDCEEVLGYFLHHYPYLGVGGEPAKARLDAAFQETALLWEQAFGEPYGQTPFPDRPSWIVRIANLAGMPAAARCADHSCHVPESCACRSPGACK